MTSKSPFTTQQGEFPQQQIDGKEINLALGQPSPRLLPLPALADAAGRRLRSGNDPLVLQYGIATGTMSFRRDLAAFLSARHGIDIIPETLMVSGGNSMALALSCPLFLRGGAVVCEDPTYFLARGIFESHGAPIIGIPVDQYGMRVDLLEKKLEEGIQVDIVYSIPAFHNPTAVTLGTERREQLLELAHRFDFTILADEPYGLLHFGDTAPLPLASQDPHGRVVSLGSFSKILGPGLRLGWIHAAPALLKRLAEHAVLRSGGGLNPVIAAMVHELLADGFLGQHIDVLRNEFRQRADTLNHALARLVPTVDVSPVEGGYFAWLDFGAVSCDTVLKQSLLGGLKFTPGSLCGVQLDHETNARFSFAFYEAAELEVAAERLASSLEAIDAR